MKSTLNAALVLALATSAFAPFGPHALEHAVELEHDHDHDGMAHERDAQSPERHRHEFQAAPASVRITASGVRLPAAILASLALDLPRPEGGASAAPVILSRSLDPPPAAPSSRFAALCSGNRAPPAA